MSALIGLFEKPLQGIVFTVCVIAAFLIGVVGVRLIFRMIPLNKLKKIKTPFFEMESDGSDSGGKQALDNIKEGLNAAEKIALTNKDTAIVIPYSLFKQLMDIINNAYDTYINVRHDLESKLEAARLVAQRECVKDAIAFVCGGYENKFPNGTGEHVDILQLYLASDLNEILIQQLGTIVQNDLAVNGDQEVTEIISNITYHIIRDMKTAVRRYPLVDVPALSGILETYSDSIKQAIQHTVLSLKVEGKKFLDKEIDAANTRQQTLRESITNLLHIEGE